MPALDLAEAEGQDFGVERPFDAQRHGHVVERAARFELIDEPETLLGERQGQRPPPQCKGWGEEEERTDPHRPGDPGLDPGGEVRQHRGLEEIAQRQLDAECAAQARHHPRRQQRVSAELEEVVGRPDPLEAEQLGPDAGEDLLDRRARRQAALPGPAAPEPAGPCGPPCRSG